MNPENEPATVPPATQDLQEEVLDGLRDLLPGAFADGKLDVGALLRTVGASEVPPSFIFSWPGITQARIEARSPTTATLVPDPDASLNWETASDVIIEGDNLQVLKLLKMGYTGAVKLIYIDPPYNLGETFTYKDDFAVPEAEYLQMTGQVDQQGNPLTSDLEKGGRKHAPWLTMMFPRLVLARHLLRRDGVILVSIDDNEMHHLRLLLDAMVGADNFVGTFVWNGGRKNDARRISVGHDYIVAYARDLAHLKDSDARWRERKSGLEEVYQKVEELLNEHGEDYEAVHLALLQWFRELPEEHPSKAHAHFNYVDGRGVYFPDNLRSPNPRPNLVFTFRGYQPHPNGWAFSKEKMERLADEGRIVFPDDKSQRLKLKSYLKEHEEWPPASVFYKDRRAASRSLADLMGGALFDYPKDVSVLARLVDAITEDGDLIVDFFAGSGSTAEAVWSQNRRDGGRRQWLLVQAPEPPDESSDTGKRALEEGYSSIFELAAERIRRVAARDSNEASPLGFRVFRTSPTNLRIEPPIAAAEGAPEEAYLQANVEMAEQAPIVEGADALSVVWEVLLKSSATKLDARVCPIECKGATIFQVAGAEKETGGRLLVCLDEFSMDVADELELSDNDTLILRGDLVDDGTALTLASRLQSKLVLIERVPRAVSL